MPWRLNRTVSLASSPSPSRIRMVPSPYFECRTRWPFLRLAAPVEAGISIGGRELADRGKAPGFNAPAFPPPAVPPKNRAILSIEPPSRLSSAGAISPLCRAWAEATVETGAFAVIHEATNGLDVGVLTAPAAERTPPAEEASWLSSS